MKAKGTTYLLITVVVTVWGLVAYKLISGINGAGDHKIGQDRREAAPLQKQGDSLRIDYPDPFLKNNLQGKVAVRQKERSVAKKSVADSSGIRYLGRINIGKRVYYLINNRDTTCLMQAGERGANGMRVVKELNHKLIVESGKIRYEIPCNNE
jgi:hypothetical protein